MDSVNSDSIELASGLADESNANANATVEELFNASEIPSFSPSFSPTVNETSHNASAATVTSLASMVGWPFLAGCGVLILSLLFFGLFVHMGWIEDLAPRIANRPRNVIKSALLRTLPSHTNANGEKGGLFWYYPMAWITWAFDTTYKDCLTGIPGTGTRRDGLDGPLLKTNLDAVVLMRFHTLMFKVALLVAIICTVVILPINLTAGCDKAVFGEGTCAQYNKSVSTNYLKTTIASIPPKLYNNDPTVTQTVTFQTSQLVPIDLSRFVDDDSNDDSVNTSNVEGNSVNQIQGLIPSQDFRIWAILASCLIIYIYTFWLLVHEWRSIVVLRREYFLETTHYSQRMAELDKQIDQQQQQKQRHPGRTAATRIGIAETNDPNHTGNHATRNCTDHVGTDTEQLPPPYLTHPEIRETPPSIGVYSVMYQLPESMVTYDTDEATEIERQLVATTNFFDEIIPPQDGFSSSVAAVTILPDARLVAKAWTSWMACELKIQDLRLVRRKITALEDEKAGNLENDFPQQKEPFEPEPDKHDEESSQGDQDIFPDSATVASESKDGRFRYKDFNIQEYARSLGFGEEVDSGLSLVDGMGIEEFNIFAYECALLAGRPNLKKQIWQHYDLDELREEEKTLTEGLKEAQEELIKARDKVTKKASCKNLLTENRDENVLPSTLEGDTEALDYSHAEHQQKESSFGIRQRRSNATTSVPFNKNSNNDDRNGTGRPLELVDHSNAVLNPQSHEERQKRFSKVKRLWHRIFRGEDYGHVERERKKHYGEHCEQGKAFVTILRKPVYAVVTFTNRQSAVIARQCLADGGGGRNVWKQVDDIPIYPLADAPPMMFFPRGFMRPVTPNITYTSKKIRLWAISVFIVSFTVANVYFVNQINRILLKPQYLEALGIPSDKAVSWSTTISGATQTLLFSVSPVIFKLLANCDGQSASMEKAEQKSITYFWYFYVVARFMGQIIWEAVRRFLSATASIEDTITEAITELASTVPTALGPSALSVIIFQFSVTWPAFYFLPIQNFATNLFRLTWINRLLKGGGPGLEVPYRIYVDNGYIFACVTALAPLCPLIGPFGLLYYIVIAPMLRWVLVFGYRPRFDGGGDKWPKLYHIVVSSLLLGQFITAIVFFTKLNNLAGCVIGFCVVPTLLYNNIVKEKYLRPFKDAALLQTGRLSNNDSGEHFTNCQQRQEYCHWLVDCHKASYVPTCLSGGTNEKLTLTAAPAKAIPKVFLREADDRDKDSEKRQTLLERKRAKKEEVQNLMRNLSV